MPTSKSYQLHIPLSREVSWGKVIRFSFLIPRLFFNVFWLLTKPALSYFFALKLESKTDLKNLRGPLIIVSNHASWIDPFLIGVVFPFNAKSFPVHYATWWKYYYFPLFTPLLWLLGSFPVRTKIGLKKALIVPTKILQSGGVIGIFPTGKRTRKYNKDNPPKPKRGAAYLALKNNISILPVKIEGNIGMKFRTFLTKKHQIKIKIGKPFYLTPQDISNPESLNVPADYIMSRISQL